MSNLQNENLMLDIYEEVMAELKDCGTLPMYNEQMITEEVMTRFWGNPSQLGFYNWLGINEGSTPSVSITWHWVRSLIQMKLLPNVKHRTSEWVEYIIPNIKEGTCELSTKTTGKYLYKNVSRRAMTNLKLNPNMSFGFWANVNLVNSDRTTFEYIT